MTVPTSEQLRVLVVDDDEMNRRMMRLVLSREDHHVELASDGFEACKVVEERNFDIILMDLQMPLMDGVETSRRIRALENKNRHVYIVALTASFLPEKGHELFEAGIDNYIAKPFDVEHLRQMLKHGLDHRMSSKGAKIGDHRSKSNETSMHQDNPYRGFDPEVGLKRVGGDEEAFRELLSDFLKEIPHKIDTMIKILESRDMDGLSRSAHNLKGVSLNLGALQLSDYAGRLENTAGQGYTESIRLELEKIETVSKKFIQDASDFLSGAGKE